MSDEREPCSQCGQPSDDWMVAANLAPPQRSWCGACKLKYGRELMERVLVKVKDKLEKKCGP